MERSRWSLGCRPRRPARRRRPSSRASRRPAGSSYQVGAPGPGAAGAMNVATLGVRRRRRRLERGRYTPKLPAPTWALRPASGARKPFACLPCADRRAGGARRPYRSPSSGSRSPGGSTSHPRSTIPARRRGVTRGAAVGIAAFHVVGGEPGGRGARQRGPGDADHRPVRRPKGPIGDRGVRHRRAISPGRTYRQSAHVDAACGVEPGHLVDAEIYFSGGRVEDRPGRHSRDALSPGSTTPVRRGELRGRQLGHPLHAALFAEPCSPLLPGPGRPDPRPRRPARTRLGGGGRGREGKEEESSGGWGRWGRGLGNADGGRPGGRARRSRTRPVHPGRLARLVPGVDDPGGARPPRRRLHGRLLGKAGSEATGIRRTWDGAEVMTPLRTSRSSRHRAPAVPTACSPPEPVVDLR